MIEPGGLEQRRQPRGVEPDARRAAPEEEPHRLRDYYKYNYNYN